MKRNSSIIHNEYVKHFISIVLIIHGQTISDEIKNEIKYNKPQEQNFLNLKTS